jgi:hypothetical protein
MKVCVTMVGVCRPSFERVKQNIESNIAYFSNIYKNNEFTFIILTYKNEFYGELSKYCSDLSIETYFLEHIEESQFKYKVKMPNCYRLFYSMEYILNKIPENKYDCIIRLRLDTEIKQFELYDTISNRHYYTINENGRCSDNIGYGSYNLMKNVWKLENCILKGYNTEEIVYKSIKKYNYNIKHFKFHFILYQSNDESFNGVIQWSRRSREWIYDGNLYVLRDI